MRRNSILGILLLYVLLAVAQVQGCITSNQCPNNYICNRCSTCRQGTCLYKSSGTGTSTGGCNCPDNKYCSNGVCKSLKTTPSPSDPCSTKSGRKKTECQYRHSGNPFLIYLACCLPAAMIWQFLCSNVLKGLPTEVQYGVLFLILLPLAPLVGMWIWYGTAKKNGKEMKEYCCCELGETSRNVLLCLSCPIWSPFALLFGLLHIVTTPCRKLYYALPEDDRCDTATALFFFVAAPGGALVGTGAAALGYIPAIGVPLLISGLLLICCVTNHFCNKDGCCEDSRSKCCECDEFWYDIAKGLCALLTCPIWLPFAVLFGILYALTYPCHSAGPETAWKYATCVTMLNVMWLFSTIFIVVLNATSPCYDSITTEIIVPGGLNVTGNFETGKMDGWSCSAITSCGAYGNVCRDNDLELKKTFASLVPGNMYTVSFDFIQIGSWYRKNARVSLNGENCQTVFSGNSGEGGRENQCGDDNGKDNRLPVVCTIQAASPMLDVRVSAWDVTDTGSRPWSCGAVTTCGFAIDNVVLTPQYRKHFKTYSGYVYTFEKAKEKCEESGAFLCSKSDIMDKNICSCGWTSDGVTENPVLSSRSYSSWFDSNHKQSMLDSLSAWRAGDWDTTPWMRIDLGANKSVIGVVTQGRKNNDQRVTSYSLSYSHDDSTYHGVDGGRSFSGNDDRDTKVTNYLVTPVSARYVKFSVLTFANYASMRAGIVIAAPVGYPMANGTQLWDKWNATDATRHQREWCGPRNNEWRTCSHTGTLGAAHCCRQESDNPTNLNIPLGLVTNVDTMKAAGWKVEGLYTSGLDHKRIQ